MFCFKVVVVVVVVVVSAVLIGPMHGKGSFWKMIKMKSDLSGSSVNNNKGTLFVVSASVWCTPFFSMRVGVVYWFVFF